MELSSPFLSFPFALILQCEKKRSGYILTLLTPDHGLQYGFFHPKKNIFTGAIQPFSLIECIIKTSKISNKNSKTITELSLLFSFTPPYTEFFHFTALQNIIKENQYLLFGYLQEEKKKIFLLLLTFLQQSNKARSPLLSFQIFIAFFWKWSLITKAHTEIFYCYFCKGRFLEKTSFLKEPYFWQNYFICNSCKEKENLESVQKLSELQKETLQALLYFPFEKLMEKELDKSILIFANHHLESFLYCSPKQALSRKNNPFTSL